MNNNCLQLLFTYFMSLCLCRTVNYQRWTYETIFVKRIFCIQIKTVGIMLVLSMIPLFLFWKVSPKLIPRIIKTATKRDQRGGKKYWISVWIFLHIDFVFELRDNCFNLAFCCHLGKLRGRLYYSPKQSSS